jgi:hypothetical protein
MPRFSGGLLCTSVLVVVLSACDETTDPNALGREVTAPSATAGAAPGPAPAQAPAGAFTSAPNVALLPFEVRLAKVAAVAGVAPEDPLLAKLRERRLDLGDHDFASGVKPDTSWTSSRMTTWVKALRPVCASPKMRARFSALPDKLDDLVLAAYGRRAAPEDRRIVDEALAGAPLDEPARYETICLAVLSSLEFVAR